MNVYDSKSRLDCVRGVLIGHDEYTDSNDMEGNVH